MSDYRCVICAGRLPDNYAVAYSANGVDVAGLLDDHLIPMPADGGPANIYCSNCVPLQP